VNIGDGLKYRLVIVSDTQRLEAAVHETVSQ
jgi:hypothetical protein